MISSNNVEIIMTEMTDMAGRARRYTCFITVKTRNFNVLSGILKFWVYMHFRFYATLPGIYHRSKELNYSTISHSELNIIQIGPFGFSFSLKKII